mgnify:CR=1 FL=1
MIFTGLRRVRFSKVSYWSTLTEVRTLPGEGEYKIHRLSLSKDGFIEIIAMRCSTVEWQFGA